VRKLQILMQIAQRNADARRIELAGIDSAIIEARRQVEAHDAAAAATELARRDGLAQAAFGLGVRQARRRREQLSERLEQLEAAGEAARAALHAACAELKRLQCAAAAAGQQAARRAQTGVTARALVRPKPMPA
jgi:hypothetical protein